MKKSLSELVQAGLVTPEDALAKANHPQEFRASTAHQTDPRFQTRPRPESR